jgi:hypothetical protein
MLAYPTSDRFWMRYRHIKHGFAYQNDQGCVTLACPESDSGVVITPQNDKRENLICNSKFLPTAFEMLPLNISYFASALRFPMTVFGLGLPEDSESGF